MMQFITATLPWFPPGRSDMDWGVVASKTVVIVEEMSSGTIDDVVGVDQLNEVLQTFSQVEWMGTFNELLTGEHGYAIKVRAGFRGNHGDDMSGGPIQLSEKEAFCEFLENWGF